MSNEIEQLNKKIDELKMLLKREKESSSKLVNLHRLIQESYLDILKINEQHTTNLLRLLKKSTDEKTAVSNRELLAEAKDYYERYSQRHNEAAQKLKELDNCQSQ